MKNLITIPSKVWERYSQIILIAAAILVFAGIAIFIRWSENRDEARRGAERTAAAVRFKAELVEKVPLWWKYVNDQGITNPFRESDKCGTSSACEALNHFDATYSYANTVRKNDRFSPYASVEDDPRVYGLPFSKQQLEIKVQERRAYYAKAAVTALFGVVRQPESISRGWNQGLDTTDPLSAAKAIQRIIDANVLPSGEVDAIWYEKQKLLLEQAKREVPTLERACLDGKNSACHRLRRFSETLSRTTEGELAELGMTLDGYKAYLRYLAYR